MDCPTSQKVPLIFNRSTGSIGLDRPAVQAKNNIVSSKSSRAFYSALVGILLMAGLTACTTATEKLEERKSSGGPYSRVFYANYEDVEIALKQSMIRYPQKVDNTEAGIFETDYIKGEARFRGPHESGAFSPGYRYRILVRLVRGRSEDKPAIKVQVTKRPEVLRDFFSEPVSQRSDGLEEQVILYRIGRELQLARAIGKANDKANKKTQEAPAP
jgi:hypothetical protein